MKMRIQPNESGENSKVSVNESRKNSKRKPKKVTPIQRLYQICKEVFADCGPGIVPAPDKIEKLAAVLDGMTQGNVGLRPNMPLFNSERAPVITYLHIHECDKFSIGIFCLPPTSVIPLHNHPGMTVFSKLLFGTMHIKSYDWSAENVGGAAVNTTPTNGNLDGLRLAKVKVNSEFTAPCRTSILYPSDGGNMHCFTAKTACAVLDVLGPPYCDPEGRHCQYYLEYPVAKLSVQDQVVVPEEPAVVPEEENDGYAWLAEREKPEDFTVVGLVYDGPKIGKK